MDTEEFARNATVKWGTWGIWRAVGIGFLVALLFGGMRTLAAVSHGIQSGLFDAVDLLGTGVIILIASKAAGGMASKIGVLVVIVVSAYLAGLGLALVGVSIALFGSGTV